MNTKIWTMFMKVMRIRMMCNLKQTDNPLIFQGGFVKDKGTKICEICESVMCIGLKFDTY